MASEATVLTPTHRQSGVGAFAPFSSLCGLITAKTIWIPLVTAAPVEVG